MFFVKIKRREYQVRFRHENVVNRYTVCKIWSGNKIVAESVAECHPKDNFCYDTGRKVSLARALQTLFPNKKGKKKSKATQAKKKRSKATQAKRQLFWDAYAEKRGGID